MAAAMDRVRFAKRLEEAGFDLDERHGILEIAGELVERVEAVEWKSEKETASDSQERESRLLLGLVALSSALAGALALCLLV